MKLVFLTAVGVGGATILGSILGYFFRNIPSRFDDTVMSFAAGVMLSAAIMGLILPGVSYGGRWWFLHVLPGIFVGAVCLSGTDRVLHRLVGHRVRNSTCSSMNRVILFVAAIAVHNFPEGMAAGVSFGTGDIGEALLIAGGIALQNIPEGMVTVTPMLAAGISPKRALQCGVATGLIEIAGTLIGYYAVTVVTAILPFSLAFAGGTMLFVICDEMIPQTHAHGNGRAATYSFLAGFSLMLICDIILG